MFVLGFNEFIRNFRKNILVIVQMVAVYIIALFTVSAFEEQYRLIDGVSNVFDETGMNFFSFNLRGDDWVEKDVLTDKLLKVEGIGHSYMVSLYDDTFTEEGKAMPTVWVEAWNPKDITYVPKLIEGKWCEDADIEDGIINAVVTENLPFPVEIGQIIEHSGYKFKVTGIISTKEMIYGIRDEYGYDSASYLDFYTSWESEMANKDESYLFLIPYEAMIEEIVNENDIDSDYASLWGSFGTIDFADDITDEEMRYNLKVLEEIYGRQLNGDVFYTADAYEYSWKLIDIKIMPMLMLLAVIIIALIISLIISVAINVLYEKKNYGIYFICGNSWKNTFKLSLSSWTILAGTSLIIAGCGYVVVGSLKLFSGLSLSFSWMHVAMLVGLTAMLLMITMIIPFFMLRKIQPVSILKENDK